MTARPKPKEILICGAEHAVPHLQGGRLSFTNANWGNRSNIMYRWGNLDEINDLSAAHAKEVVRRAMATWEAAGAGLKFVESTDAASFEIAWLNFSKDTDSSPGPDNAIAHGNKKLMHFDIRLWWLDGTNINGDDAESVALHELGHVLGLPHSQDRSAIMYPSITRGFKKRHLGGDDYDQLYMLYPTWRNLGSDGGKGLIGTPAVICSAKDRTDIFVRGANNEAYYKWRTGREEPFQPGGGGFQHLGGPITSNITAVSWGPGRIDLFARGADGDVVHKHRDGGDTGTWSAWESIGGKLSPPYDNICAVSGEPGRIDVIVGDRSRGAYHRYLVAGGTWSPSGGFWEPWGGNFAGAPATAAWGQSSLDVFARHANGGVVHCRMANGSRQNGWTRLGTPRSPETGRDVAVIGDPSVVMTEGGGIVGDPSTVGGGVSVFVLGDDMNTYMKKLTVGSMFPTISEWTQIPGRLWSRPVAMPFSGGFIYLAAFAQNGNVILNEWNANQWSGWTEPKVKLYENKSLGSVMVQPPSLSPQEFYTAVGVCVAVLKNDQSLWFLH